MPTRIGIIDRIAVDVAEAVPGGGVEGIGYQGVGLGELAQPGIVIPGVIAPFGQASH